MESLIAPKAVDIPCPHDVNGEVSAFTRFKAVLISPTVKSPQVFARALERSAPAIFVLLWSTGFIGAKLGLPYAEPFTFLALRMAITLLILIPFVWWFVDERASPAALAHSAVTGFLVHGVYLGGIFVAIDRGMSAGISALIVALQPLLTTLVAWAMLDEKPSFRQIAALFVALGGVFMVISPQFLGAGGTQGITTVNLAICFVAVFGIAIGSVYQKRYSAEIDLRLSTTAQYAGALMPLALCALFFETRAIEWSGAFVFALSWLVVVLSLGAVSLLMFLIRRDSVSSIASLFYLVPVSTAIIAYFLFDEKLQWIQLAGMAIVIAAVAQTSRRR